MRRQKSSTETSNALVTKNLRVHIVDKKVLRSWFVCQAQIGHPLQCPPYLHCSCIALGIFFIINMRACLYLSLLSESANVNFRGWGHEACKVIGWFQSVHIFLTMLCKFVMLNLLHLVRECWLCDESMVNFTSWSVSSKWLMEAVCGGQFEMLMLICKRG